MDMPAREALTLDQKRVLLQFVSTRLGIQVDRVLSPRLPDGRYAMTVVVHDNRHVCFEPNSVVLSPASARQIFSRDCGHYMKSVSRNAWLEVARALTALCEDVDEQSQGFSNVLCPYLSRNPPTAEPEWHAAALGIRPFMRNDKLFVWLRSVQYDSVMHSRGIWIPSRRELAEQFRANLFVQSPVLVSIDGNLKHRTYWSGHWSG